MFIFIKYMSPEDRQRIYKHICCYGLVPFTSILHHIYNLYD